MLIKSPYHILLKEAEELKIRGEHNQAIKICQSILIDDLECNEALEEIGDNYMNLRDYNNAIIALQQAINIKPDSANAHYLIGFSYSSVNKWEESITHLETANKLEPNHPEILRCLGWSLFHQGKQKQGLVVLFRATTIAPNDTFILFDLGMCYLNLREFKLASEQFNKIIELDPQNTKAKECLDACKFFSKK